MRFPRLKNALLCRILVYVVVLGSFFASMAVIANLNFIPEIVKSIACIGLLIAFLIYLVRNFVLLMSMDIQLATLHCRNTARKRFALPQSFSVETVERRISRFGKKHTPPPIAPTPNLLQYKSQTSMTIWASGIEKIIAVYHVDFLDQSCYHRIVNSASVNSNLLKGKKKHHLLDKSQKNAPLNRVTVILIFTKQVDERFRNTLFEEVSKHGGDGLDTAVLPCVVDLETRFVTFDSVRLPYVGVQYPVKNRGIKLIRKYLFNNKLTYGSSPDRLEPIKDIDPEQSLWSYWRSVKESLDEEPKKSKHLFEKMSHRDIVLDDSCLYLKWENRGLLLWVELNEERREAKIDEFDFWHYPKINSISKETVTEIKTFIDSYFSELGYTTKYIPYE